MGWLCCCKRNQRIRLERVFSERKLHGIESQSKISIPKLMDIKTSLQYLSENTFESLPLWGLEGEKMYGKVTKVIDADTIEIVVMIGGGPQKHRVRFIGIDTPELNPIKTVMHRDLQKKAAQKVCDFLIQTFSEIRIPNVVWVEFGKKDKFGRILGEVFIEDRDSDFPNLRSRISINKLLLDSNMAKPFGVGKRESWTQSQLENILSIT
jgi:endonuclease YncB( thermonuclease family)